MAETLLARVRHFLVGADYSQKQQKYVTDVADHGEPSQPNVRRRHHALYRYWKQRSENRQEISIILKYVVFGLNFIFWVCGVVCMALGVYMHVSDFRAVIDALDFVANPYVLLIVSGCLIFVIAFLGCTGALRENICMLKLFGLGLFFAYITLVILAFVVFILFYSNSDTGVSIQSILLAAVRRYRDNKNMEYLMDVLQSQLECCGATVSQGYKDWDQNPHFNCSALNSPEACGVPYSCCKQPLRVMSSCGFLAQKESITELNSKVNTEGCVAKLQKAFEGYAVIVGAVIGAIIVPVCLSITLSNVLANQIDRQRYILDRQARRDEKLRRRKRRKFRDPMAPIPPAPTTAQPSGAPKSASPADSKVTLDSSERTATIEVEHNPIHDSTIGGASWSAKLRRKRIRTRSRGGGGKSTRQRSSSTEDRVIVEDLPSTSAAARPNKQLRKKRRLHPSVDATIDRGATSAAAAKPTKKKRSAGAHNVTKPSHRRNSREFVLSEEWLRSSNSPPPPAAADHNPIYAPAPPTSPIIVELPPSPTGSVVGDGEAKASSEETTHSTLSRRLS